MDFMIVEDVTSYFTVYGEVHHAYLRGKTMKNYLDDQQRPKEPPKAPKADPTISLGAKRPPRAATKASRRPKIGTRTHTHARDAHARAHAGTRTQADRNHWSKGLSRPLRVRTTKPLGSVAGLGAPAPLDPASEHQGSIPWAQLAAVSVA